MVYEKCGIMAGVALGDGSVVGYGSVVTKDVVELAVVAGCPAKVIGHKKKMTDLADSSLRFFLSKMDSRGALRSM